MNKWNKRFGPWICHRLLALFLTLVMVGAATAGRAAEPSKFLALGTGASNGVFYPVGEGICELLNMGRLQHGYRCLAYSTGAAVYNIQALETGGLDLGITYANLSQDAAAGVGVFAAFGAMPELRSIAALYEMPAGIFVNSYRNINSLDDLKGLRINIGNIGSGKRTIADAILAAMHWSAEDFAQVTEFSTDEIEKPFCAGEIDVIIEAMATSSNFFRHITSVCDAKFISLPKETIAAIRAATPTLEEVVIPAGTFAHNPEPIITLGINAVLVTSARVNADAVYAVVDSIFRHPATFRSLHPALADTAPQRMVERGRFLPFHPGAERYYKEQHLDNGPRP